MLPQNPQMLLSYINTMLRDEYASLEEFCDSKDEDRAAIEEKLASIGYRYDRELNKFV